jgi:hypothetical protein
MNIQSFTNQRHYQIIKYKQNLSLDKIFSCQIKPIFNLKTGNIFAYQQLNYNESNIIHYNYIGLITKIKKKNQLVRITLIPLTLKTIDANISLYINNPIIQNCKKIGNILKRKSKLYYIIKKLNNLNLKKQL